MLMKERWARPTSVLELKEVQQQPFTQLSLRKPCHKTRQQRMQQSQGLGNLPGSIASESWNNYQAAADNLNQTIVHNHNKNKFIDDNSNVPNQRPSSDDNILDRSTITSDDLANMLNRIKPHNLAHNLGKLFIPPSSKNQRFQVDAGQQRFQQRALRKISRNSQRSVDSPDKDSAEKLSSSNQYAPDFMPAIGEWHTKPGSTAQSYGKSTSIQKIVADKPLHADTNFVSGYGYDGSDFKDRRR